MPHNSLLSSIPVYNKAFGIRNFCIKIYRHQLYTSGKVINNDDNLGLQKNIAGILFYKNLGHKLRSMDDGALGIRSIDQASRGTYQDF